MMFHAKNPSDIRKADIVVGIPSFNEAALIRYPTEQAALGLKQYFNHLDALIINCDNNSSDGTGNVFMNTDTAGIPKMYLSTPEGVKGKGNNFKNLFRAVLELQAKAIIVVDADLKSITPRWVKNLGEPLFNDFGFVAPLYVRHKYDGTITNNIAYPLTRCLYGRRVRQPIGGDFGFSGNLAGIYLKNGLWNEEVSQFGIDIWMTTIAINEGIPICQAFMGRPKVHKPKDPAADLGPMFKQVISTAFNLMITYHDKWSTTKWSKPTAIFGFGLGEVELPPPVSVSKDKLYQHFKEGFQQNWDIYRSIFSVENFQKLREIASLEIEQFEMPVPIWAKILFDFALSYYKKTVERTLSINVLIPLYYGMTLSFVNKTEGMSIQQAEEYLEDMCLIFEQAKPYLIDRWSQ
ncbi:MAG: glycosyl transferase [Deltaproteobacteria bacterium]|nr:glycosyl transferase [Deltaproteobacteria bacterium]